MNGIRAAILDAVAEVLNRSGDVLSHPALSGLQITVKLRPDKTVRTAIVEPELRFEK